MTFCDRPGQLVAWWATAIAADLAAALAGAPTVSWTSDTARQMLKGTSPAEAYVLVCMGGLGPTQHDAGTVYSTERLIGALVPRASPGEP